MRNMPQPDDLKYTFIIGLNETQLLTAPSGWEDGLLKSSRSEEYYGMLREYSVPMTYHLDGAYLLRKEFYTKGLNADVKLRIEELNRSNWSYEIIYEGSIDFSTFIDRYKEVEVSIMDGGISEMVKAYEDVQYEIKLTEANSIKVKIPGVGLIEKASSIFTERNFALNPDKYNLPSIENVVNNLDSQFVTIQSVDQISNIFPGQLATSVDWFLQANQETEVDISGVMNGTVQLQNSDQTAYIEIRNQDNILRSIIASFVGTDFIQYEVPFTAAMTLDINEKLFIIVRLSGPSGPLNTLLDVTSGEMNITNSLVTEDTPALAMRAYDLFKELLRKMNEDLPVPTRSDLLDKEWKQVVILSGGAIRQLDNPVIKTSFKEFFKSMNSLFFAGFGIENNVAVLEHRSYWYKTNLISVDLGTVKTLKLDVAETHIFNTIKAGYDDNEYEVDYGREEVNSTQYWTTPITRIQRELDLVSPYRADQFGIEEMRLVTPTDNVNSKDDKSDNDTFVLKVKAESNIDGEFEVEGREAYKASNGVQGVSARESYYNLDLTPKKNLLRHGAFLKSMLHRFDGQYIRFESGEKNTSLVTIDLNNNRVAESEFISISNLDDRIFLPYLVTIVTKVPKNVSRLLKTNPTGIARFTYENEQYEGFFIEATVNIPRNSEREWILLLSPNSDIKKLIR